jgi:hypothetical protein
LRYRHFWQYFGWFPALDEHSVGVDDLQARVLPLKLVDRTLAKALPHSMGCNRLI